MSGVPRDDWVALQPHGTRAAYRRHRRHGERACESCLQAERRSWQTYSARLGQRRGEAANERRRERYWQARAMGLSSRQAKHWRDTAA